MLTRRQFVASSFTALGATSLLFVPRAGNAAVAVPQSRTVKDIMDLVLKNIPDAPFDKTVDTLKSGSPDQVVTGIVTTMFATQEVIKKAISLKANFIIAHEPTFYNHLDETTWLEADNIYRSKRELLEKNGIAIWRLHDYLHALRPDGVLMGVLISLGWERYYNPDDPHILTMPGTPLNKIVSHLKEKLSIPHLRIVGDLSQVCQRIALMPGASGGRNQIGLLQKSTPDLLICGEVQEWETSEYIRDAQAQGVKRSLVVLGHAQSEEPGLKWLVDWLSPKVQGLTITHIPSGNPFTWV